MTEKKRLIELVKGLSSWCHRMSEMGPQRTRLDFLELRHQAERFLGGLENSLGDLANWERLTKDEACRLMRRILFRGHSVHRYGRPNGRLILDLCIDLRIRAPEGWHRHFMLKNEQYRLIHRPRRKWRCPDHILETWRKNRRR